MKFAPRRMAVVVMAALALAGCVERKQVGVINPDGSGKTTVDLYAAVPSTTMPADKFGEQIAAQMIARARGVDAWKDISIDTAKDGRAHIVATAYFHDINSFRLDAPFITSLTKNADGTYTFSVRKDEPASQPAPPNLSDEQIAKAIAQARSDYKQQQPAMETFLNNLQIETTYTLPGVVTATNVLKKVPGTPNGVTLSLSGKQVLKAMDKVMADDKLLANAIRAGNSPTQADDLLTEAIFGQKGPISATVSGTVSPQFDFAGELTAAKAAQAETFEKAHIDVSQLPTPWNGAK